MTISSFCLKLPFVLCFVLLTGHLSAQETTPDTSLFAIIRTTDGNEFVGKIRSQDSVSLVLITENFGQITLRRERISSIEWRDKIRQTNGQIWRGNRYFNQNFFLQNAYGLDEGEGYYQNGWVFYNQASYGFTKHFSLSAGFIPLFLSEGPLPVFLQPKISIPLITNRLQWSLTGVVGSALGNDSDVSNSFGALYSQLTFGSRDANLTAGFGYGFGDGRWTRAPIISLAGQIRSSAKTAFISENYFFPVEGGTGGILSFGVRFMGRNIALDVALLVLVDDSIILPFPIPWLGIRAPFGRKSKSAAPNH